MEKQASEGPHSSSDDPTQKDEHYYRPLLLAAYNGDWDAAARFFEKDPGAKTAMLTPKSETALHIASMTSHDGFVERLVNVMTPESLAMLDSPMWRTALHYATIGERIRMMKALVGKNFTLTQLPDKGGKTPLHMLSSTFQKNQEALRFLAKATTNEQPGQPFTGPHAATIICNLTYLGFQDVVLDLVKRFPDLLTLKKDQKETVSSTQKQKQKRNGVFYPKIKKNKETVLSATLKKDKKEMVLSALASHASNFLSGSGLNSLETLICKWIPVDVDMRFRPLGGVESSAVRQSRGCFWEAAEKLVPRLRKIRDAKLNHDCSCELVRMTCENISDKKMSEIFHFFKESRSISAASACGTIEVIEICLQYYPELIWMTSSSGNNILSTSIIFRQERVFRLISNRNALLRQAFLCQAPKEGNEVEEEEERRYLMWEVAKLRPNFKTLDVSGAAFHMQSEVQWFKAVEEFVDSLDKTHLINYQSPWIDFKVEKEELRMMGEQWMKETSNSCMLVATLIATVVFAGAFTIPGGNRDNTGTPLLLGQKPFMLFSITNALALFSSITAVLMFLSILTSRYDPIDFLKSLPQKFIIGLACLFLSLAFMLVSFVAAFTILMDDRFRWIVIPIVLLSSIPIVLFVTLQLPLFVAMVESTYRPKLFHGKRFWKRSHCNQ